jgi:signal transduction histidine kinase
LDDFHPSDIVAPATSIGLKLDEGLGTPLSSESGEGIMFAQGIRGLSTDHLDLGEQIAASVIAQLQRNALLRAAEDRAAARSRISLARDLHDSVVQFLAGAAFRLEALKRGAAAGDDVGKPIEELKQLMLHEQGELRAFIAALRSGSRVRIEDVATELRVLAERLAKHWTIKCDFSVEPGSTTIPARLHLDAQQLVREAVANAVRHANAKSVSVRLAADNGAVVLQFINDGKAYPKNKDGGRMPQSLRERVEDAGGKIELSRGMGVTRLSISLPVSGAAA